jgi:IclR family transcriptional regulator, pca regulon regulatory protein
MTQATDMTQATATMTQDAHDPRFSRSLERGLAVLSCFTPERPVLGITDIADALGLSKSTTHRYAVTLVALGYLEQGPASPKYRLGLRAADLGLSALSGTGLREHAHVHLEELRRRSSFTVGMAVLEGGEIRYVDRVRGHRGEQAKIDLGLHPGSTLPAYCTALGKVLLAYLPPDERRERIAGMAELTGRAPHTITGKSALRAELERVRETGIAIDDEELTAELRAIAAPVRDQAGEVLAAINLVAHTSAISLDQLVGALGPHLIATADRISARLGYRVGEES